MILNTADRLATEIRKLAEARDRVLVAIAGPPGAGKSTLAAEICRILGREAALVPLDGFHLDNRLLEARGLLDRKGAPETFDVAGLASILTRIKAGGEEVIYPVFDRDREIAIAGAGVVTTHERIVIVEGNYLLLDPPPWDQLWSFWDITVMIEEPETVLEDRLSGRWQGYGLSVEEIEQKMRLNDLPNGEMVRSRSAKPGITFRPGR